MQHYIPLEYDRSHLEVRKADQQQGLFIDYFDIILIIVNLLTCIAIATYYIITPKKLNQEITLKANEKYINDIPHFTYSRHGKKTKLKEQKQSKDFNPHTHFVGYNLVELKCLKCTHTTEVYELKTNENS